MRFVEVWELHYKYVHRRCVAFMRGDYDAADEACSRTAVQAFRKWRTDFSDAEHAKAWLLTIARNSCIDVYRERRKRHEISLDHHAADLPSSALMFAATHDPERQYAAREQSRLARACIEELPPLLRQAATLHFVSEMPYVEVARRLGITEVNARKRIQQARQRLRSAIDNGSLRR